MDSITQGALGGLCGELTLRKELGWRAFAWGVLFGTLPDLDVITFPFIDDVQRLSWHRGLSHSIIVMVIASVFFGWLLAKIHRRRGVGFKKAAFFVFITWSSHVAIDCFTTYGTQIYEPFSKYRFASNNMSIIDISFTLPMLLALLIALFLKKSSALRSWVGRAALIWISLYTAASFVMKSKAEEFFRTQLTEQSITPSRMMTAPTLSNIFLWRMLAETEGEYHVAYWSLFDAVDRDLRIDTVEKGHDKLSGFDPYREMQQIKWFTKGWYVGVDHPDDADTVLLVDMRFGELCSTSSKTPVFIWSLKENAEADGGVDFQKVSYRTKVEAKEVIGLLWGRILGKSPSWMDAPWRWEQQSSVGDDTSGANAGDDTMTE